MNEEIFKTHPAIRRYEKNPILTDKDVPFKCSLAFNAGVTKFQDKYVMIFRNDIADEAQTRIVDFNLGLAFSSDGIEWEVQPEPLFKGDDNPLRWACDPRITVLEDKLYLTYSLGTNGHGICGGLAVTSDLEEWEVLNVSAPDNRNMVIFPERINGKIVRLERPFAGYCRPGDPFDTWISSSPDGRYWGETKLLLTTEEFPWVNDKIGPGTPPVRTEKGWLSLIHCVDLDDSRKGWGWAGNWNKRYSATLMLQDIDDPYKVIGLARNPILVPEPEFDYEAKGYRDYVIFPGGLIIEDDGEAKIYYGSADTVEALAFSTVDELLKLCKPFNG